MSITNLPSLDRTDPNFREDVDTFFGTQLPTFTTEMNEEIDRINTISAGSYSSTSSSSVTVGTGSKTLIIESGKGFAIGQFIVVAETSNPTSVYITGQVTAYNSTTGSITLEVSTSVGSGSYSDWSVSIAASVTGGGDTLNSIIILTSGTSWVAPADIKKVRIRLVGGGGGGGRGSATNQVAEGGASGGYVESLFSVTAGNSYTYSIGAGGPAAFSAGSSGSVGGTTTFDTGTIILSATGGGGGTLGYPLPAGGVGSNGDVNLNGGSGNHNRYQNGLSNRSSSLLGEKYGGGGYGSSSDIVPEAGKAGAIILELYK